MSMIGIFVGAESPRAIDHRAEDPSSALRLAALAASFAASRDFRLLALGDAPALLAVGTAVLGRQQSRVLEGGERRPSPVRILSLLESENRDLDRSLSFRRRSREQGDFEEGQRPPATFGDLSLLMDIGVMDLAGEPERSLEPRSPGEIAENLSEQLFAENPRGIIAIGQMPEAIARSTLRYTRETRAPFACLLSNLDGANRLVGEPAAPVLNGRTLRFRDQRPFDGMQDDEEVQETSDEELMQEAQYGAWEAELAFNVYRWLTSLDM